MRAALLLTPKVKAFERHLKEQGCAVHRDNEAGTVVAKDGDKVVFRAIQKGRGQPWITAFYDSDRITWKWSD